jgi:hypothetical protein
VTPGSAAVADVIARPGVDRTSALTRLLSLGVARGLLHDALPTGDTAGADAEMALPSPDALDKLL